MRRIRAVSFDLFGTLFVYGDMRAAWRDWLRAIHGALSAAGLSMGEAALARRCDGFFERPEPPDEGDGLTVFEARIRRLAHELGLAPSPGEVSATANAAVSAWQRHVPLDPEAPGVLAELARRVPLVLVSNFDHPPHVHRLLDAARLTHLFRARVVSAEVGVRKPDPCIFTPAIEALGLAAGDVLHVGDTSEDVDGARAAGLVPVLIRRGEGTLRRVLDYQAEAEAAPPAGDGPPDDGRVPVIASLGQLLDLVPLRGG